ncbi:MAG TPA: endonuclease, partial [Chitinophagaceae bacterium]|nr:endonuclease [Chitinophagaceae bacterium]
MKKFSRLFAILLLFPCMLYAQGQVKVMSYNIRLSLKSDGENWWENRKDKVTNLMNYYEADFIGMQEVLQVQLDYLKENLTDYNYIGVARDD